MKLVLSENLAGTALHISNNAQFTSIIKPFSNCTTIVYVFKDTKLHLAEPKFPIILLKKEIDDEDRDSKILEKCSFVRRRNPSTHCRAFVIIQPETSQFRLFTMDQNNYSNESNNYSDARNIYRKLNNFIFLEGLIIQPDYGPQYTIWITTLPQEKFQVVLEEMAVLDYYTNQEFLLVSFNLEENKQWKTEETKSLEFHVFNRYYENTAGKWFSIHCNLEEERKCFKLIDFVTTNISFLNKYFWNGLHPKLVTPTISENHKTQGNDKTFANFSDSFNEFLIFWLKSTFPQNMSSRVIHRLSSEDELQFPQIYHEVVITEMQSYNFMSCHGVIHRNSINASLLTPFHTFVWIFFANFFSHNSHFTLVYLQNIHLGNSAVCEFLGSPNHGL